MPSPGYDQRHWPGKIEGEIVLDEACRRSSVPIATSSGFQTTIRWAGSMIFTSTTKKSLVVLLLTSYLWFLSGVSRGILILAPCWVYYSGAIPQGFVLKQTSRKRHYDSRQFSYTQLAVLRTFGPGLLELRTTNVCTAKFQLGLNGPLPSVPSVCVVLRVPDCAPGEGFSFRGSIILLAD